MHLSAAASQAWPPFLLITGLLLVGLVAGRDGLFEEAGRLLSRLGGPPWVLLGACLLLDGAVTAILNLDTAAVLLTPVLVNAARERGIREEGFLYGAVFMANASSLFLPGSNLTNLLVLSHRPASGATFAAHMLPMALAAAFATLLGLFAMFGPGLRRAGPTPGRSPRPPGGLGLAGTIAAAALTVALRSPALPVLGLGLALGLMEMLRGRLSTRQVLQAVGPVTLAALFLLCLALGVLARAWHGPEHLLAGAGRWETTGVAALASVLINNLPSAVLLSAGHVPHPRALLLGLNAGPNLAASGALSALLWWRAARAAGARPSVLEFSRRGAPLAVAAMAIALAIQGALGGGG